MPESFLTKSRRIHVALPVFIPVYRPDFSFRLFSEEYRRYGLNAVMVNAFLLFRDKKLREKFENGYTLREHIGGFPGMLCTDSGAFQQLSGRKVDLDALEIVRFQNTIMADIAAPLDLITPPDTSYEETLQRMIVSHHRIEEAARISDYSDLSGIQQGGGFFSLRQKHIRQLAELDLRYYGIGSMVPFFNKNHDLHFTCSVIQDARNVIGPGKAMHVYGAGDPLDMAFMYRAGANVFDSSSYAHYARGGFYMTPFGAVCKVSECERLNYECRCPVCVKIPLQKIFNLKTGENLRQQHNLFVLLETVRNLEKYANENQLDDYISEIHDRHLKNVDLFPNSQLGQSWEKYLHGESCEKIANSVSSISASREKNIETKLSAIEETLVDFLATDIAETYKMEPHHIARLLAAELFEPANTVFRRKIGKSLTLKNVQNLSEYKAFRKKMRSLLYQKLRQYKTSDYDAEAILARLIDCGDDQTESLLEQLLSVHVSTRERLPHKNEFLENVCDAIAPGSTVIDIGCGYNPLVFPREFYRKIARYIAVDKDAPSIEAVRVFARKFRIENMEPYIWDIASGLDALEQLTGIKTYDFAMMLKVIPVVQRLDRVRTSDSKGNMRMSMTTVMGNFPATRFLATVSRESMTKHESIEKRELGVLREFLHAYDFTEIAEFSCGSEFGYWVYRNLATPKK